MIPVGHRISPDAARSLHTVRVHDSSVYGNLSRVSWKLSRTVLRGGTSRKVGPPLDQNVGKAKQPYCFEVNRGELFAFAGLWETWNDPSGKPLETCSILTTTPNESPPPSMTECQSSSIRGATIYGSIRTQQRLLSSRNS